MIVGGLGIGLFWVWGSARVFPYRLHYVAWPFPVVLLLFLFLPSFARLYLALFFLSKLDRGMIVCMCAICIAATDSSNPNRCRNTSRGTPMLLLN